MHRVLFCNAKQGMLGRTDWSEWRTHRIYGMLTDWENGERKRERTGKETDFARRGKRGGAAARRRRKRRKEKRVKREVIAVRFVRGAGGNRWEPTVTNKSNTNVPAV